MAKSDFVIDKCWRSDKNPPTVDDAHEPTDGSGTAAPNQAQAFAAGGDGSRKFYGEHGGSGDKGRVRYLLNHPDINDLEYGHAISIRMDVYGGHEFNTRDVWLMASTTSQTAESMVTAQEAAGESTSNAINNVATGMQGYHCEIGRSWMKPWLGGWGAGGSALNWVSNPETECWFRYRFDIIPSNYADKRMTFVMYRSKPGEDLSQFSEADFDDPAKCDKHTYVGGNLPVAEGFQNTGGFGCGYFGSGFRVGFSFVPNHNDVNADRLLCADNYSVRVVDCRSELGL